MDVINASALSALFTGYRVLFQQAYDAAPSYWDRVAMLVMGVPIGWTDLGASETASRPLSCNGS